MPTRTDVDVPSLLATSVAALEVAAAGAGLDASASDDQAKAVDAAMDLATAQNTVEWSRYHTADSTGARVVMRAPLGITQFSQGGGVSYGVVDGLAYVDPAHVSALQVAGFVIVTA